MEHFSLTGIDFEPLSNGRVRMVFRGRNNDGPVSFAPELTKETFDSLVRAAIATQEKLKNH